MRRRKKKGSDEKLLSYQNYVIKEDIDKLKGVWSNKFNNNKNHISRKFT